MTNQPLHKLDAPPTERYPAPLEDEINLIDLWLVLVRRKRVLLSVAAIITALGIAFAFLKPQIYEYATSIEIGTRIVNGNIQPIESASTVLAKINESYIPLILHDYASQDPERRNGHKISAKIPKNSEIIVLQGKGSETQQEEYLSLLQQVIGAVQKDHRRINDVIKKEIEIERNQALNKLAEVRDQAKFLRAESERLKETKKLLQQQVNEGKTLLSETRRNRQQAVKRKTNETMAMTLLLLDSEIRANQERIAELEERLNITLAREQDMLVKGIENNARQQSERQDELAKLELSLANLSETRAVVPPMQSLGPVGKGKTVILVLAVILGVFLGIFAAFFAEFIAKARAQLKEETA